ncbi:DUF4834 family protein [Bacteroides sp. 214]|uniref:DUF4834 family protein n=1 Tax=Bacteroides sp. 214 TaxID=2302935 RepID=UPI0013D78848|nr:DUF4834 family protein [Bacteroides sp. 214]NDW12276.1 DUF4834 family protein [Bacteroides sp. 214]
MSFLAIIFFFLLAIFLFGVTLISSVLRAIFGRRGNRSNPTTNTTSQNYQRTSQENQSNNSQGKKIFDKNEGEYVDFEEVK